MASARLVSRMTIDTKSSDGVRAFKRGLDILQEVNRSGGIRAGEIAWRLDLPRPTVYRLLETLEELGYVARSASDNRFRVTRRAAAWATAMIPGSSSVRLPRLSSPISASG